MPYEFECVIAPQIKKQKKTSKYRIINWVYKKLYGYEYESTIQSDLMMFDGKIMFKDQETYNRVKDSIEENRVYQLNCTECHNAIFHQDYSWEAAVRFFEKLLIVEEGR